MNRKVLVVLLFLSVFSVKAENRYLPFTKGRKSTEEVTRKATPVFSIDGEHHGDLIVNCNFDGAYVSSKLENNVAYDMLHIEGFNAQGKVGAPALPVRSDYIAAAIGDQVEVSINEIEYVEYPDFEIYPALERAIDTEGTPDPVFYKDEKEYSKDGFYPQRTVSIVSDQQFRSARIVRANVCPVQYNPKKKILRVYSKLKYSVHRNQKSIHLTESDNISAQIKSMVLNGSEVQSKEVEPKVTWKDYLIVTTEEYRPEALRLASWKSSLGFSVDVISKDKWTCDEVSNEVSSRYHRWPVKPKYLLIIGDHKDVPAKRESNPSNETFYSDLQYVCMDGANDYTPDLAKGRISVSSVEEAKVVIDKIISYEKDPVDDEDFYHHGLNCAQFQDVGGFFDIPDGYAERRFCQTSEVVRSYMIDQGYDIDRIYYTDASNSPTHFNNGRYGNGEAIADELLRSNGFQWNGSDQDIQNAINEGRFYVLHRDHGYSGGTGWAHPEFLKEDIEDLNNGDKLPVVFSINCHTGEFQLEECFAEKFLRKENGGAVAVIAASYYSYSGNNDGFALGMFESIWPNPGLTPLFGNGKVQHPHNFDHATTSLGDVVNLGLLRMTETWGGPEEDSKYTYQLFHLFGDPSMKIWKAKPEMLSATLPLLLEKDQKEIVISDISEIGCTVTIVQGDRILSKKVTEANEETISCSDLNGGEPLSITISKDGYKPVYKEYDLGNNNAAPIAHFEVWGAEQSFSQDGNVVKFIDRSRNMPTQWKWNFGTEDIEFVEGTSSTSQNPKVRFLSKGHYPISLTVSNENGENTYQYEGMVVIYASLQDPQCKPNYTEDFPDEYGITSFKMGGLKVSSEESWMEECYQDFTSQGYVRVALGQRIAMTLGLTSLSQDVKIFLDQNGDNMLSDGEVLHELHQVKNDTTFFVNIDNTCLKYAPLRLRIISDQESNDITDACYNPTQGQVEDYAIRVVSGLGSIFTTPAKNIQNTSATLGASHICDGMYDFVEKGIVLSDSPRPTLDNQRFVVKEKTKDDFEVQVDHLESNKIYYYRAYVINGLGTSYGIEREFRTFTTMPKLSPLVITHDPLTSTRIDLSLQDAESKDQVWGYLLKWSEGNEAIQKPVDGVVYNDHCKYLSIKETKCFLDNLISDHSYHFQLYRYVNNGDRIDYEDQGSNVLDLKTLSEGNYSKVSVTTPISCIESVKCANIANTSARPKGGYYHFIDHSINLKTDYRYKVRIRLNIPRSILLPVVKVWIDSNHDGVLDQQHECVRSKNVDNGTSSFEFYLRCPATANGRNIMRIACFSRIFPFSFSKMNNTAHVEDYPLVIGEDIPVDGRWTGQVSREWNDPMNWASNTVPSISTIVSIEDGAANYPIIHSDAAAQEISISSGASLDLREGSSMDIDGSIELDGALNIEGGVTTIKGNIETSSSSVFTIYNGELNGRYFTSRYGDYATGQFMFYGGNMNFNSVLLYSKEANKSVASVGCNINVKEDFGISFNGWKDNFCSTVTYLESGLQHHLKGFGRKQSYWDINRIKLKNLRVNIGPDTLFIESGDRNVLEFTDSLNILSGVVKETNLYKMELNELFIGDDSKFNLDDASVDISGSIKGNGIIASDASTFTFKGKTKQECNVEMSIARLVQSSSFPLSLSKDVHVSSAVDLETNNIILNNGMTFNIGDNVWVHDNNKYFIELKADATVRDHEEAMRFFGTLPLSVEGVDFTIYSRPSLEDLPLGSWISYTYRTREEAGVVAPNALPFVLDISCSASLQNTEMAYNLLVKNVDLKSDEYYWSYKTDVWNNDGQIWSTDRPHTYNLNSPEVSLTCMTKREAPKVSAFYVDAEHVKLKNIKEGSTYCYSQTSVYLTNPFVYNNNSGIIVEEHPAFGKFLTVAYDADEFSIRSEGTVDLMKNIAFVTSTISLTEGKGFNIYPNPIVSQFTIVKNDKLRHQYIVTDLLGRVITSYEVNHFQETKQVNLPTGIYLLKDAVTGEERKMIVK